MKKNYATQILVLVDKLVGFGQKKVKIGCVFSSYKIHFWCATRHFFVQNLKFWQFFVDNCKNVIFNKNLLLETKFEFWNLGLDFEIWVGFWNLGWILKFGLDFEIWVEFWNLGVGFWNLGWILKFGLNFEIWGWARFWEF